MPRAALVVGLLVLVVASGCLTTSPARTGPAETTTTTADPPFKIPNQTIERNKNPWGTATIEVVVENRANVDRNVHPEVMKTMRYWEDTIDPGQRYAPEFLLAGESSSPDIRVEVVDAIDTGCRVHSGEVALGCAPVVPTNATVTEPVTVQVRADHSPDTTLAILKHEFGHVLGYRHGEGPDDVMSENITANAPDDIVNATDRQYPWASRTLSVAVTSEHEPFVSERERVERALQYYARGADGAVAAPPRFEIIPDADEADIVVELVDEDIDCASPNQRLSCADWDGVDVDDDGTLEYITDAHIAVERRGHERAGWHLGYWLGQTLWTHDVPGPFLTRNQQSVYEW